ncbi:unnamed protein product [Didymodactylos carnosus]|uniref:Uncharacterized protein n=1 Tax=Didymodactylos carnosus TaxID=1234261 RepID=A0A816BC10_9BILA|nr:unnamed protein product [Didymodactylos carnosus]CAF1607121.1 unnamed protein product [Didymodactylos carnosus]CAF4372229.1 unnamed protein product [Didymodactylos carnosus]CAF4487632.1 unnamed protein product [Didymodactylos carnosus]
MYFILWFFVYNVVSTVNLITPQEQQQQPQTIFERFSLQHYLKYNDSFLLDLIHEGTPSKIFAYCSHLLDVFKYSSSIDKTALLYAVATATFDLADYRHAHELLLRINQTTNVDLELNETQMMLDKTHQAVSAYLLQLESLPDEHFFYRWSPLSENSLTTTLLKSYSLSPTVEYQLRSYLKYYNYQLINQTILLQLRRLIAIETGRVEQVYEVTSQEI